MTCPADLENLRSKTGKGPEFYRTEAKRLGLESHAELRKGQTGDCGWGHGHANAMIPYIRRTALANSKLADEARSRKR